MDSKEKGCLTCLTILGIGLYWGLMFLDAENNLKLFHIIILLIIIFYIIALVYICDFCCINRLKSLKKKYPHAFQFFMKQFNLYSDNVDLYDIADTKKFLSIKEEEWIKIEKQEVELRQKRAKEAEERLRIISERYKKIEILYPDGIDCWKKVHPTDDSPSAIVENEGIIKQFDERHKAFLATEEWEKNQEKFTKLCRSKINSMPHCGYYHYNIEFLKMDYDEVRTEGKYLVWQFFYYAYCSEANLDYTHFQRVKNNFESINSFREGKIIYPSYICDEIIQFIKSLNLSVQLITLKSQSEENQQIQQWLSAFSEQGYESLDLQHIDAIEAPHVIVFDTVTSNKQLKENCKEVINKFKRQKPCITYISLLKEFSRKEMEYLIDKKKKEIEQQRVEAEKKRIEAERKRVDNEKQLIKEEEKQIETAIRKRLNENKTNIPIEDLKHKNINSVLSSLHKLSKRTDIDQEIADLINKNKQELQEKYDEGIVVDSKIEYFNYYPAVDVQDKNNWNYPVVKYPEHGTIVFPYRRRAIARRGYMEKDFQFYLQSIFRGSSLRVIGDCSILPRENRRPYEPDIAIIDTQHPGIRIDVEIDEPYAAITNKPIHYVECGDDFRDLDLNNLGWIVIRFTEYQVFSNMTGCAAFIVKALHDLNILISLPVLLVSSHELELTKRWSKIEAQIMASEKSREKYLEHEFGVDDSEQLTITDIKQNEIEKKAVSLVKPILFGVDQSESDFLGDIALFEYEDSRIQFFPHEHIYLYNGREQMVPVSNVIAYFFKPFNSNYWSDYKARQRGVPQGLVLEEWNAKGMKSREVGTFMHKQIELSYKGGQYQTMYLFKYAGKYIQNEENVKLDTEYQQFVEFRKNHRFKPFKTEWVIYDAKLKIAGTIDMIHQREENVYDIYDWKRSHRIVYGNGFPIAHNNFGGRGIRGLEDVEDTSYWHYCLQQNLYRYILEKNYGIKVGKMYLVVFIDDMPKYTKLEVPYMDNELEIIVRACQNGDVRKYFDSDMEYVIE